MRESSTSERMSGPDTVAGEGEDHDAAAAEPAVEPDITYDEQFYPARPKALRPVARRRQFFASKPSFEFDGRNAAYVEWLRNQAMLGDANVLARQLSGQASMWQNSYAHPNPAGGRRACAGVVHRLPLSFITRPGQSFLSALGDPETVGRRSGRSGSGAVHTGPVKLAGGISGWSQTPSVDGHFDRISMAIDPMFGTEDEFRRMCAGRRRPWRDRHRRHRPRPHRQGRGFPAGRDEFPGLSRASIT